jgi:hypothetical protein
VANVSRFRVERQASGLWLLTSTPEREASQFADLPAALNFARAAVGGGEANIEILADGVYMLVHQPKGWPHCICR